LIEFLTENIFEPINKSIQIFEGGSLKTGEPDLRSRDLIASRRLHWLAEKVNGRLKELLAEPGVNPKSDFILNMRESLQKWICTSMPTLFNKLSTDLRNVLLGELTEELLYQTRSRLPNPLDESIWCNVAIDLMRKTVHSMAHYLFCYAGPIDIRRECLGEHILEHAVEAAASVRNGLNAIDKYKKGDISGVSIDHHINQLSFKSRQQIINKEILLDESKRKMISLYDTQNTICFGAAAAMADIQAYYDAMDLCGIEPCFIPGGAKECHLSIVSLYEPNSTDSDCGENSLQFNWIARSIDAFKKGDACVNEKWYLENQVLAIVHILATDCVNGKGWYSLEKICEEVNLELEDAKKALSLGVPNPTWPKSKIISAFSPGLSDFGSPKRSRGRPRKRQPRK